MNPIILADAALLTLLLIAGVPVPFCFAGATLFLFAFGDINSASFLIGAGFSKVSSIILIAIPLYILAGGIMSQGGPMDLSVLIPIAQAADPTDGDTTSMVAAAPAERVMPMATVFDASVRRVAATSTPSDAGVPSLRWSRRQVIPGRSPMPSPFESWKLRG